MQVNRKGKLIEAFMTGSIGESTPLFILPLRDFNELVVDMSGVNMINSIGVKHWIIWTGRIPKDMKVNLVNCPYVIVSQASMVMGFLKPQMKIASMRLPFVCDSCGAEDIFTALRGTHYEYRTATTPVRIELPENRICAKCGKGHMEPDFLSEKTFKFLNG